MAQIQSGSVAASGENRREAERLAALDHLGAVRPEADRVLQGLVDDAREAFGTDLCMVNLVTSGAQYFRAWSGELPAELAEARQDPRERSMCRYVVETEAPLVVEDFLATEEFRDQHFRVNYGIRFYAGTPLITSDGHAIGSLCLLHARPREGFGEDKAILLRAFAKAVLGRLETLGALERERAAKESEREYRRNVFELANDAILVYDPESGLILDANNRACEMYAIPKRTLVGKSIGDLSLETRRGERYLRTLVSEGSYRGHETVHRRGDGAAMHVSINSSVIEYEGRRAVLSINRDVTERKRAEEALRRSERELAEAQRIAHVGNWSMEVAENRLDWSDEMYRIAGFAPREFVVTVEGFLGLVHPDDREPLSEAVRAVLQGKEEDRRGLDYRLVRPGGEVRHVRTEYEAERDGSGRAVRLLGATHDVTEREALEGELEHQALHDSLTGLPNRSLFSDRLGHALSRAEREGDRVAVLFVDLDNFKYVNDSLGHQAGDRLLVATADRLRKCLRPGDTAARFGGDEFAVLLEGGAGEAERVAGRIVKGLREPFVLGGQEVFVTPSIGIAAGGPGGEAPEDLLRRADLAMYRAKGEGKARYRVFEESMEAQTVERLKLENDLRRALERDELVVRYQPVVRLSTGRIAGFEALIRWEHPERGLVLPDEFVALAEDTGQIVPIGQKVLREACRQAKDWRARHPGFADPPPVVGVNLSARQLLHPGVVGDVEAALEESGLEPGRLTLEITEGAFVEDGERSAATLRGLKNLGVRFALDDFGTGYSSLSYLRRLPVGMLKIDRSFVERLGRDPEDEVVLEGVVGIARGLGLLVCAEGVETPEQLARAKALGCDLAQGNLFSGPLPPEAAGALLAGDPPSWRPPHPVPPPRRGTPAPQTGS